MTTTSDLQAVRGHDRISPWILPRVGAAGMATGGNLVQMQTHVGLQVMAWFEGEAARGAAQQGRPTHA